MKGDKHILILSYGGNMINTYDCFTQSNLLIENTIGKIVNCSKIYESEAWGFSKKTSNFLNQIIEVETKFSVNECLSRTQEIEIELGRADKSKNNEYTDRPIDIDLLFYDKKIINEPKLTIPHYLIEKRKFILVPLNEIFSNFVHPVLNKTINQLLLECEDELRIIPYSPSSKID